MPDYEVGASIVYHTVGLIGHDAKFAFPPREVSLIVGLDLVGDKLARNKVARDIVKICIDVCKRMKMPAPTVMMLRCALDHYSIAWQEVTLDELGFRELLAVRANTRGTA